VNPTDAENVATGAVDMMPAVPQRTILRVAALLVGLLGLALLPACGSHEVAVADGNGHQHLLGGDASPESVTQGEDGRWYTTYADTIEVSAWAAGSEPTGDQRRTGADVVDRVRDALAGLTTVAQATAAGYAPHPAIDEFHLVNQAHLDDGTELDPTRPEFVVIDPDAGTVLGAMFLWPADEHGPQFGGPATVWHYHDARSGGDNFRCWDGFLPFPGDYDATSDQCQRGVRRDRSPEMLHVWAIDHPQGPFATRMPTRT
jgi:hypothetical protein